VLHFYADKSRRHADDENGGGLSAEMYEMISAEIDRMIEKGGDYSFATADSVDRGWVFCPEFAGAAPLPISPADWDTRVFLFGPGLLPDLTIRRDSVGPVVITGPQHDAPAAQPQLGQTHDRPGRNDVNFLVDVIAEPHKRPFAKLLLN